MKYLYALMLLLSLIWSLPVRAVQPDEVLSDPKLEARARALSQDLRCLVCQNESIDDSEAPLAHDIRVLVRERIQAGDSDAQVISFLVSRYGEFVLLKPPLSWHTAMLWGLPPGLLLVGIVLLVVVARRRAAPSAGEPAHLTSAEEARVMELLRNESAPEAGR
ncbi:MAG TPA: cytochrome c-type biogenesis protein [Xanthobacteraceae bacterium]|nr:cytochrome c-type biogenesis protein [Xanthobacteraceae bacterium]